MKPKVRVLWTAPVWRGLLEGWLAAFGMILASHMGMRSAPPVAVSMMFVLTLIACAGVAGLRIRLEPDRGWRFARREGMAALLLAGGLALVLPGLLFAVGSAGLWAGTHLGWWGGWLFCGLSAPGYLCVRAAAYLWRFWGRLRQAHYKWELTHTILATLGGVAAFGIVALILYSARVQNIDFSGLSIEEILSRLVIWIPTLFLSTLAITFAGLMIVSLPAFWFSARAARKLTNRLEVLTRATQAVRTGDLSVRVAVEGQDELATLQANFNAMAVDLERSTRELRIERDKVAGLYQVQQGLTAGISHELRTPAATLIGYVDSLRRHENEQLPEPVARDLEVIAHEAGRMQLILNDLLTLAQSEACKLSLNPDSIQVGAVACQVVETLSPLAWETKRIQLSAQFSEPLPAAWADGQRVEQILLNLVQNAIRHTPPGGAVVVTGGSAGEQVWVEVADTGEGISPEDLPHIWEPFYRAAHPERAGTDGFGLGLPLVKELTEMMGGSVSVATCPAEGSVFRVSLPVCPR